MNERAFNKMSSSQKYNWSKINKENRIASMAGNGELKEDLDYYTWPMLHKPYSSELNELGLKVEAEKRRRGLI